MSRLAVAAILLGILAVAHAQDMAVAASRKGGHSKSGHKSHGSEHHKHDDSKYDKYEKHGKEYEHKSEHKYEHKYEHEKPYYRGEEKYYEKEGPYYGGEEYYEREGPYYGGDDEYYGYDRDEEGNPIAEPRYVDFKVQLGEKTPATTVGRKLLQAAPQSNWRANFVESVDVYCDAEVSYGSYKHDEDAKLVAIAKYTTTFKADTTTTPAYTKCYGHKAKIVGQVVGILDSITADADDCDRDLKKDYTLETDGDVAAFPALLKLPDSVLANHAKMMYEEYYDERSHAVCGLAYMFNGTATYGSPEFWAWLATNPTTEVENKYAYWGFARYVAGFNGKTMDGKTIIEVPNGGTAVDQFATGEWEKVKAKCLGHRGDLPVVEYGELEVDLRRFDWSDVQERRKP